MFCKCLMDEVRLLGVKGFVHFEIKTKSSCTHPGVVLMLFALLSFSDQHQALKKMQKMVCCDNVPFIPSVLGVTIGFGETN